MADFGANVLSSSVALLGLLVIMGLIYTIWSQINMKKKQKYFKELHTELKPGQEVLFGRRYLRNRQRHRRREGPDQSPIRSRRRCFALRDSGDQVTVVSK